MEMRFSKPATSVRPGRSHRFDVYGIKVSRPLTLFGQLALRGWIELERDPLVSWYCERPHVIEEPKPRRLIDFYSIRDGIEQLQLVRAAAEIEDDLDPQLVWPTFATWCRSNNIDFGVLDARGPGPFHVANWAWILRELAAFDRYVSKDLRDAVLHELSVPLTLGELQSIHEKQDPILVRTACFRLLHSGQLLCATLDVAPFGHQSLLHIP